MGQQRRPATVVPGAPVLAIGAECFPAAVLDLDACGGVAAVDELDLDLGRIGPIAVKVPEVAEALRRLPDRDLAPVVLETAGRPLEDSATGPAFQEDRRV